MTARQPIPGFDIGAELKRLDAALGFRGSAYPDDTETGEPAPITIPYYLLLGADLSISGGSPGHSYRQRRYVFMDLVTGKRRRFWPADFDGMDKDQVEHAERDPGRAWE